MSQLTPFFDPAGVAVIGASADPHKLSHGVLRNCVSYGYRGAVYPVNPRAETILGLPSYPSIAAVPDPVELAVVMTPAATCPDVLAACGERGIRAAIVISGGFREVGEEGQALETRLLAIARQYGMRLIGPNCVGTLDAHTGLNTTFIRTMPKPGPIAFVSQSGAICGGILEWTAGKGIGFSRFATLGNAADVTETDLIEELASDPRTRVIVAYIEAIRDGRRFIEVARAVTPHKPILVIKAGRTVAGTRAVSSHTGSLAGAMAAYDAAFKQAGVLRVDTVEELFDHAWALAYGPLPRGPRVAVVTNAGGPASLAADALEGAGLTMPVLSGATRARLASFTHPEAQLANPVDMLGGAEPEQYRQAVAALLADDDVDAVLPILVPQALVDPVAVAAAICQAAQEHPAGPGKPVVACFMGDEVVQVPIRVLNEHGMAGFIFPEQAARALGALERYAEVHKETRKEGDKETRRRGAEGHLVEWEIGGEGKLVDWKIGGEGKLVDWKIGRLGSDDRSPITDHRSPATGHRSPITDHRSPATDHRSPITDYRLPTGPLGEVEARPVLEAYGIPQPRAALAADADEAAALAAEIGFPVALKIVSPDIFHKSEVGGIVLALSGEDAVRTAFSELLARVHERQPGARLRGALVSQMAPPGHELIVGMRRDPQFGPLVMVGLGGIYVELLKDVAFRVAPFGRGDALAMLAETHAGKLLAGVRGQPRADVEAVAGVIERVARLALEHPEIEEIDINPLLVYPAGQGALAVDVRMVVA